jgi:hypothetical protein
MINTETSPDKIISLIKHEKQACQSELRTHRMNLYGAAKEHEKFILVYL